MSIPPSFQTKLTIPPFQTKLTIPPFQTSQPKLTVPPFPPAQSKLTVSPFPPAQSKLTIPPFPSAQSKLTVPPFQATQPPRPTLPIFQPVQSELTVPAFQATQPPRPTLPIFQPVQSKLTVPIFLLVQPKQLTSVPQPVISPYQPKQLTSVPQPVISPFQLKQLTSVPQPRSTIPLFQPKQLTPAPQPVSVVQTKQQFQTITSPPNQQFQISASSQQKLISIPPSSGLQLQKIQTSTASPQNQQFQTITSPQTPQFQMSGKQQLTGTLVPSGIQSLGFQTSMAVPQSQTITGVLLPPPSKAGPPVLRTATQRIKVTPTLAPLSSVSGPILSSTSPRPESDQNWRTFRRDDLFLLENDGQTAYHGRANQKKTTVHWGQRKLALTTLEMINLFWNPEQIPKLTVVYAGSAPGTNLKFVMEMYPQIEWHLYDPHPVGFNKEIEAKPQVHTFKGDDGWFTDQIAKEWEGRDDVFFISDVRTDDITEMGIWKNMKMQEKWVKIIKPVVGMLKFRLPYSGSKFSDEIDYTKGFAPYLAGIVLKQPWAGQTSTETRLLIPRSSMINGEYPIHNWNIKVYEDKMFHLNSVIRESVHFYNPFYPNDSTKRTTTINQPELLNDWDSLAETTILNDLLTKTGSVINRLEGIKGLSNLLTISLRPRKFMTGKEALSLNYLRRYPDHFKSHFRPANN